MDFEIDAFNGQIEVITFQDIKDFQRNQEIGIQLLTVLTVFNPQAMVILIGKFWY